MPVGDKFGVYHSLDIPRGCSMADTTTKSMSSGISYDGLLEAVYCYIHSDRYDMVVECGAEGSLS